MITRNCELNVISRWPYYSKNNRDDAALEWNYMALRDVRFCRRYIPPKLHRCQDCPCSLSRSQALNWHLSVDSQWHFFVYRLHPWYIRSYYRISRWRFRSTMKVGWVRETTEHRVLKMLSRLKYGRYHTYKLVLALVLSIK